MGKRRPKKRQSTRHTPSTNTRSGRIIGRKGPVYFVMADNREQTTCVARGAAKRAVIGDRVAFEPKLKPIWPKTPSPSTNGPANFFDGRTWATPTNDRGECGRMFVVAAAVLRCVDSSTVIWSPPMPRHQYASHFVKIDLLDPQTQVHIRDRLQVYRDIGISVLEQTFFSESLAGLAQCLHNKTGIFVGHSGVGKTSLINTLCPDVSERVQAISEATGKGQHTDDLLGLSIARRRRNHR